MNVERMRYDADRGWIGVAEAPDSRRSLVILFGGRDALGDGTPIASLLDKYPSSVVVGCSSAGEIHGTEIHDDTLVAARITFEEATFRVANVDIADASHSRSVGEELAEELASDDLRGVFVLSDGLNVNGSELVRGLNAVLPSSVTITGGLAGDGDRFERTWVLSGSEAKDRTVCAVGFYGKSLRIAHGSKGGWDAFGVERTITRSEGNVLFELDGRPALELYKEYLGDRASGLPATALLFPLSIREDDDAEFSLVRTVLAVDEEQQSLTFAGDIHQGWRAQLMRANFDRLIDGAADAARMIEATSENSLVLAISCVGRRLVLGDRAEEEVEATLDIFPTGVQQIGFYSYGEISPSFANSLPCDLHNQTMTLTTLSED